MIPAGAFKFMANEVMTVVRHARISILHEPSYAQAYELLGDAWLRGEVKSETLFDRIPAGLWLVKDQGVYIMSNGSPRMMRDTTHVTYAHGFHNRDLARNFGTVYAEMQRLAGRDDFVEYIALDEITPHMDSLTEKQLAEGTVWILLLPNKFMLGFHAPILHELACVRPRKTARLTHRIKGSRFRSTHYSQPRDGYARDNQ